MGKQHENAIKALKSQISLTLKDISTDVMSKNMFEESDRSLMIIIGSYVEDWLQINIAQKFAPHLNSTELTTLFAYEGPVGGFSGKIRIAQALGIIDRRTRQRIEMIKHIRNAAAHSMKALTFSDESVQNAVVSLFESDQQKELESFDARRMRNFYSFLTAFMLQRPTEMMAEAIKRGVGGSGDIIFSLALLYSSDSALPDEPDH